MSSSIVHCNTWKPSKRVYSQDTDTEAARDENFYGILVYTVTTMFQWFKVLSSMRGVT